MTAKEARKRVLAIYPNAKPFRLIDGTYLIVTKSFNWFNCEACSSTGSAWITTVKEIDRQMLKKLES